MNYVGLNVFLVANELRSEGYYHIVFKKYKARDDQFENPWRIILYYDQDFKVAIEPHVG